MKPFLTTKLLCFFFLLTTSVSYAQSTAQEYSAKAYEYKKNKDYEQAITYAKKAAEAEPTTAKYWNGYGYYLLLDGQYQKALPMIEKAKTVLQTPYETNPSYPYVMGNLAHAYLLNGQYEKAMKIYKENAETKLGNKSWWEVVFDDLVMFRESTGKNEDLEKALVEVANLGDDIDPYSVQEKFSEFGMYEQIITYIDKMIDNYPTKAAKKLERYEEKFKEMEDKEKVKEYIEGIKKGSRVVSMYLKYRADANFELRNYKEAKQDNLKIISDFSEDMTQVAWAYENLANIAIKENNPNQAYQYMDKAIESTEDLMKTTVIINKSKIYTSQNEHQKAVVTMNKVIELEPNEADGYYWRGIAYEANNEYEKAITDFEKTNNLESENGRGFSGMSGIYLSQKDYTKALEFIDKAIAKDKKDSDYLISKSKIYTSQNEHQLAISTMNKVIELNPNDAGGYYWRGVARLPAKDTLGTIKDYEKVISLEPTKSRGYLGLGEVYQDKEDYTNAYKMIDKAIAVEPKYIYGYRVKSSIQREQKKYDEALATMNKAVAIAPNNESAYFARANVYMDMKNFAAARKDYEKVQSLVPNQGLGYYGISDVLFHQRKNEEALSFINKAIEKEPIEANYLYQKGQILRSQRKYIEALEAMESAMKLRAKEDGALSLDITTLSILSLNKDKAEKYKTIAAKSAGMAFYMGNADDFNKMYALFQQDKNAFIQKYKNAEESSDNFGTNYFGAILSILQQVDKKNLKELQSELIEMRSKAEKMAEVLDEMVSF